MGFAGPAPARADERRRTNEPTQPITKLGPDQLAALPFPIELNPVPPDPKQFLPDERHFGEDDLDARGNKKRGTAIIRDENGWHPYATYLWEQLQVDPSRAWAGPASMALDLAMCEQLSRLLMPRIAATIPASEYGPGEVIYERVAMNGSEMTALLKWASSRALYENDRLRIGKEVTFHAINPDGAVPVAGEAPVISIHRDRRKAMARSTAPLDA